MTLGILAVAACETMDNGAQNKSTNGNGPSTLSSPQDRNGGATSNSNDNSNNNSYIGNGAFGQSPP
jgi:hypothetical protein